MGLQDAVYTAITTPLNVIQKTSVGVASYAWNTVASAPNYLGLQPKLIMTEPVPLWKLAANTGPYVKLAAISGAAAVILGAVGSHKQYPKDETGLDKRHIFETANCFHFIHTLALLGLPLCRFPFLAATFFLSGIVLFSGSCYYTAFTLDQRFKRIPPFGGFCFILGWCSMLF